MTRLICGEVGAVLIFVLVVLKSLSHAGPSRKRQVCLVAGYFFVAEGEGEPQSEGVGLFFYVIGREWQVGFYKAGNPSLRHVRGSFHSRPQCC